MKKSLILLVLLAFLVSVVSVSVSASLEIDKQVVSDVVITELSDPAVFNFNIHNLGGTDNFEIYSLVSGIDLSPMGMFQITSGETKNVEVKIFPNERFKRRPGLVTFSYNLRGQDLGIQADTLAINIVDLKDALDISVANINPDSDEAIITVENKVNFNFDEIKAQFTSVFFEKQETFSIKGLERKEIKIPINHEMIKKLVAGQYSLTSKLEVEGEKQNFESPIKFIEKSGISTKETTSGIFFREKLIEKTNEGNVPALAEITLSKDIVSRLFTTFNIEPDKAERGWIVAKYTWMKELKPAEVLSVKANTNYLYPLIIVIVILIGIALIKFYTSSSLILEKRVSYVKTKGGEFALKITIVARARNHIEKIAIVDRLPPMVKLFERYGAESPNKFNEQTRRLEWDIDSLGPGEERIFSYIVYSKVGIVGRFELPATSAIYERDGKIKEVSSNRTFFMNEPRRREE